MSAEIEKPPRRVNQNADLQRAMAHHHAGQLQEAEKIYKEILADNPTNADALHLLGVIASQAGQYETAIDLITQATNADPNFADAHYNLGNTLRDSGGLAEAASAYQRAIEINPKYLDAHCNLGNTLHEQGKPNEAIAAFRRALQIDPRCVAAHANLGAVLLEQRNFDEAIASCQRALAIDANYAAMHNNLGQALNAQGQRAQAIAAFRRALEIDPGFTEAQNNLSRTLSQQIPQWHFSMLSDSARNETYQRAIEKVVDKSSRVLDIGTGSGLLALMAARAGAAEVVACEMSTPVAEAARQVILDNDFSSVIRVIDKKSTDLECGVDLRERANVLVYEIFDAGLLAEGVIPTLRHALHNLVTQDAKVIPQGALVYGQFIEIPRLRAVNPVSTICGFDLSAFDRFRNPNECPTINLEHETHRVLTEPFEILKFDFRDPPTYAADSSPHQRVLEEITITDGTVQAIAFWFDLSLDDEIVISTRPASEVTHWAQALQFFDGDRSVKQGEKIKLQACHSDTLIWFSLLDDPI